jgi:SAM-dependent methyltransferase
MAKASAKKRLAPGEEDFLYDLDSVLSSSFHMDARKPVDRLLRYERVLRTQSPGWQPPDFANQRVLEIGCGPLLGWGPIAAYLDAASYTCIEPRFRPEVAASEAVRTRFFLVMHQQLEAIFAGGLSFGNFLERVSSRIEVLPRGIEDCELPAGESDLVISNGVLQHVADLERAIERIRHVSHATTRQYHVLNFTDHVSPPHDPFADIYHSSPEQYFARDSLLNLKRPSEVTELFAGVGIALKCVPYYSHAELEPGKLHEHWRNFECADLAIQIAFFVN